MNGTYRTYVRRWEEGTAPETREDFLAIEEPCAIKVDGAVLTITMRTPGEDLELALGFMLSEGLLRTKGDVHVEEASENEVSLRMASGNQLDLKRLSRHVFASSSCGVCGKTSVEQVRLLFDRIPKGPVLDPSLLLKLPFRLRENQATFSSTGGLHAAALFDPAGGLVLVREDIGRHNAVDKVLGFAVKEGMLPLHTYLLLVSGRASFEILQKANAGGIPIVASISAPSSLAVQYARESGQTLVGFLRGTTFNIYSGAERLGCA